MTPFLKRQKITIREEGIQLLLRNRRQRSKNDDDNSIRHTERQRASISRTLCRHASEQSCDKTFLLGKDISRQQGVVVIAVTLSLRLEVAPPKKITLHTWRHLHPSLPGSVPTTMYCAHAQGIIAYKYVSLVYYYKKHTQLTTSQQLHMYYFQQQYS